MAAAVSSASESKYNVIEQEINKMNLKTLIATLEELGVDIENIDSKETARSTLKRTVREKLKPESRRRPGQAAENLREILALHNSKRERLARFCHSIAAFLPNLDKSTKDNLKTQFDRAAEDILRDVQTQLHKEECPILLAGETSSGKTTFLNLLLGDDILPVDLLSSTSTICEVKYGETRQAVVHLRQSGYRTPKSRVTIPLDGTAEHRKELDSYIRLEGASRDSLPQAERVEIFWPLPLLQGGIVIVDSPGVGESKIMDQVVADHIPESFAFLYIIDSSRAGGVQEDRLGKLLQLFANKDNSDDFNPESAMFICNKWDRVLAEVPPEKQDNVKSETFRKLSQMWPGLKESQVFHVSSKKAVGPFGILSEDFIKVLDGLDLLLPKSLDIKLDTQYRLLARILSAALIQIDTKLNVAHQNLDRDTKKEMFKEAQKHLNSFQEETNTRTKELKSIMSNKMESTKDTLSSLVKSGELKKDALNAVGISFMRPLQFKSWYSNVLSMRKNEKKESNDANFSILKELYEALADDLTDCPSFKHHKTSMESVFKQKMKEVVKSLESAHQETMYVCSSHTKASMNVRNVLFQKPSLWEQYVAFWKGVSLSSLSSMLARWGKRTVMAVWGSTRPKSESILRRYWVRAPDRKPLIDILISALSSSDELLTDLAERQMQPQRELMALLEADITKMRIIMVRTIEETFKDTRSNDEIVETYEPQSREVNSFMGQLAMFHLTEMRKYEYDLDSIPGWTDTRNKLAGGSFGEVFRVQVPWKGAKTPAALKLGVWPYDIITTQNAWDFLKEEDNLRKLKGDHIVEYYGTAWRREGRSLRLGLVMELCDGTLEDRIANREHNPAWWDSNPEKQAAAFSYTQNLAVQLCEGLRTIHDAGYIHRDLKLINILVTKDNTVKLADVGVTKREDKITGTMIGTAIYAAPEVKEWKVYDKSADIYSLGLILWEMWYGRTLFDKADTYYKRMSADLKRGQNMRMPQWPGTVPPIPVWTSLIHDCLKKNPRERPKIQQCLDRISAMKDRNKDEGASQSTAQSAVPTYVLHEEPVIRQKEVTHQAQYQQEYQQEDQQESQQQYRQGYLVQQQDYQEEHQEEHRQEHQQEHQKQEYKEAQPAHDYDQSLVESHAIALYGFQTTEDDEISFDVGDRITNIVQVNKDWWLGVGPDGTRGLFPSNHVLLIDTMTPC